MLLLRFYLEQRLKKYIVILCWFMRLKCKHTNWFLQNKTHYENRSFRFGHCISEQTERKAPILLNFVNDLLVIHEIKLSFKTINMVFFQMFGGISYSYYTAFYWILNQKWLIVFYKGHMFNGFYVLHVQTSGR